jgi:hypothetical protein
MLAEQDWAARVCPQPALPHYAASLRCQTALLPTSDRAAVDCVVL